MSNAVWPLAKQAFLSKQIDLVNDTIRLCALFGTYAYNAAHQFFSDLGTNVYGGQAGMSTSNPAFAGKTVTNGVFNATSPLTFTTPTGTAWSALAIFQDTGTAATARLILFVDTATGLPVTPNGGDISIALDAGANKIFAF